MLARAVVHHRWNSHSSRAPVAYRDPFSLDDHRHFPRPLGKLQHLVELVGIRFDVNVVGLIAIGFPSLLRVGSPRLAVDDYLCCHDLLPLIQSTLFIRRLSA